MAGILTVQTIQGPTSGANANKVIIPAGQTLDASAGGVTLPAGVGGKVLQVVSFNTTTQTNTSSTSYVDTQITASITPSSTSSKVLVIVACPSESNTAGGVGSGNSSIALFRSGTQLSATSIGTREGYSGSHYDYVQGGNHLSYLDSPSSTSPVTYLVKIKSNHSTTSLIVPRNGDGGNIVLMEIAG